MTSRIPRSFIDEVLSRVDLVEVIDVRVKLKKAGVNYTACCPFHQEKTPSFSVSQVKQFYYCFGCGASGNAISFLMEFEHMAFLEALEMLATDAGMTLPEDGNTAPGQNTPGQTTWVALLSRVMRYYQHQLRHHHQGKQAITYLKNRGLTGEICKRFAIGFSPSGYDNLAKQFGSDHETKQALLSTGMMISKNEHNSYDRFRERIMFPIRDPRGRVVGFGGRVLGDDTPKYLNSPETPLFHKGRELYGLYELLQLRRDIPRIILVEGYMDVVSLVQFGIENVVATLGTATSAEHLQRLYRYTGEIVFCFDGDNAGHAAAWRALQTILPLLHDGRSARFLFLPDGADPDDYVRQYGKEQFQTSLSTAVTVSDFIFEHLSAENALANMEEKAKFAKSALELIMKIPEGILKAMLLERLNRIVGIEARQLQKFIGNDVKFSAKSQSPDYTENELQVTPVRLAIALLLQNPELHRFVDEDQLAMGLSLAGVDLLLELSSVIREQPEITTGRILEYWREREEVHILLKLASWKLTVPDDGIENEFLGATQNLIRRGRELRIESILAKANISGLSVSEKAELQGLLALNKGVALAVPEDR